MEYVPKTKDECKTIVNEASAKILKIIDDAMDQILPVVEIRKMEAGEKRDAIHAVRWMIAQRAINRCWHECYPQAGYIFAEERERINGRL